MQVNPFGCARGSWIRKDYNLALGGLMQCCWNDCASGSVVLLWCELNVQWLWFEGFEWLRPLSLTLLEGIKCSPASGRCSRFTLILFSATLMASAAYWYSLTRLIPDDLIWYTLNIVSDLLLSLNRINLARSGDFRAFSVHNRLRNKNIPQRFPETAYFL